MDDTTHLERAAGTASGRFLLRIEPGLHAALREAAREADVSLNEYCARKLALPAKSLAASSGDPTARVADFLGDALIGVVAFGSWARQELAQNSDVDLLIVVDDEVRIGRWLYREWDESPATWNGHPLEPHFVHLPRPGARTSGIWPEVAVEGVVLFERDLVVSRLLVGIRRQIAAGRIVQRRVHGQPYWVEAA